MAAENTAAIADALGQAIAPQLYRQWNRSAVAAALIEARVDTRGNEHNVAIDAEFSGSVDAAAVDEGSDVDSSEYDSDIDVPGTLGWSEYRTAFQITQRAIDAAAASRGITADDLVDLFAERADSKGARLISRINKDIYTGTGTSGGGKPNIVGLFGGSTDATGSYAGILRGTYGEWAGNVLGNGGTPRALTQSLLDQAEEAVYVATGEPASFILCSTGVFRKYKSLFEEVRRLSTDGRGPLTYEAGATSLFYNGIPLIRDKDCPSGKLIFCNQAYVKMKFLPPAGRTKDAVYSDMRTLSGRGQDAPVTVTQIPFRIELLGKTGTNYKAMLYTTLQLCVTKPNAFCQVTDISES